MSSEVLEDFSPIFEVESVGSFGGFGVCVCVLAVLLSVSGVSVPVSLVNGVVTFCLIRSSVHPWASFRREKCISRKHWQVVDIYHQWSMTLVFLAGKFALEAKLWIVEGRVPSTG